METEYTKSIETPQMFIIICIPKEKKYIFNDKKLNTMNELINEIILYNHE